MTLVRQGSPYQQLRKHGIALNFIRASKLPCPHGECYYKTKSPEEERKLLTAEMKFLRRIIGYTKADRTRNTTIWTELNVGATRRESAEYLSRMEENSIPRICVDID